MQTDTRTLIEPALLRRIERLGLVTRRRVPPGGTGERRSTGRGSSIEFVDFRPYSPGDDPRQVDWNAYGRTGQLFVKLFEAEQLLSLHLLVDASRSMDWGAPNKLGRALQLAAALGYVGLCNQSRVQAAALAAGRAERFGPVWGKGQARALFDFLCGVQARGASDLDGALGSYARQSGRPGLALLISDLLTDRLEAGIAALTAQRFEVVVLHLLAPDEVNPSLEGDLELVDRESGARVAITMNAETLERYRARYQAWTAGLERFCARRGVRYLRFESSEPLESLLFSRLRRGGVLA